MRIATSLWMIGVALCLTSCAMESGGSSRVEGRVTDAGGAQAQSFGGAGTASAATAVRASAVTAGGTLELLAEADVSADASYALELPANEHGVILQAVDADGEVLAAAILEHSGAPGELVLATPIDSESSLEAAILIEMSAQGAAPSEIDAIDLRARVTSELALAVRIAADRGEDVSAVVVALAEATIAAQQTELEMYARAGVSVSQSDLFAAELQASSELSAALHGGADAQAAYDVFFASIASAAAELGVSAEQQGRAEAAAGASFRVTVEARLSGESSAAIRESALLAAASLEARVQEQATIALLSTGEAAADVQASAQSAAADLRSELRASASASAAAAAYARFAAQLRGEAQVTGSILGAYLDVELVTAASADAAVDASAAAAAQLDAAIAASAEAAGALDAQALAVEIATAYAAYFDAVAAQQAVLAAMSDDVHGQTAVGLLIVADGSFSM